MTHTIRALVVAGEILREIGGDSPMNYDLSQIETIRLEAMATLREERRVEHGLQDIVRQCERLERRITRRQTTPSSCELPEVA